MSRNEHWADTDTPWMRTVTIVEKDKESRPVLYDHGGKPLVRQTPKIGFNPEKDKGKS